jgi:predicted transcriptional regulator
MQSDRVIYFTEREEEVVAILGTLGIHRNVAKVLVYLAGAEEATSKDIDRGTDLREPEVSLAMRYLAGKGWVSCRENRGGNKGRPVKIYQLAVPVSEIINSIEQEKMMKARDTLNLIKRFREYVT